MTKESSTINIPAIRELANKRHSDFMGKYGLQTDKVAADCRLLSDVIFSRVYMVASCLKSENVIDTLETEQKGIVKILNLKKQGYDNYVTIKTNGKSLLIEGFDATSGILGEDLIFSTLSHRKTFSEIYSFQESDWTDLATYLLDFIHTSIYNRKEAFAIKIEQLLKTAKITE